MREEIKNDDEISGLTSLVAIGGMNELLYEFYWIQKFDLYKSGEDEITK